MKIVTSLYSFLSRNSYLLPLGVIALTLILLVLTLVPSEFLGKSSIWSYDKLGHLVLFASWCLSVGLYYQIDKSTRVSSWIIVASGISFGLIIEILQTVLPLNRHGDPIDLIFDALGCLLAVWILKSFHPDKPQHSTQTPPA